MGFFAPWFLIGAAAIALPLWLHLLRQYKRTPQPFSSLMFFERRVQSSVKHRRLRYLTLLALRIALLLLLALAFANPFVNRRSKTAARRTLTVIAIDRSFSMHEQDRMRQAKAEADRLIDGLPGTALGQVLAVDSHVESLTPTGVQAAGMKAAVDAIEANDRSSSFGELARALRYMEQTSGMHLQVHFISDMQRTSMPADFHDLEAGPNVTLALHRVGEEKRPNWAVANVIVPAAVDGTTQTRLTATVAGWDTPAEARQVALVLDGKTLATKQVTVPASGRASVEFTDFEVPYGWHRGDVRLTPGDGLPQDDGFGFAIEHADARKVLFLYARSRADSLYYRTALETGTHGSLSAQVSPVSGTDIKDFSRFAFVVLSDVGELDPALSDALCAYVEKGGSVLIAVGPNTARTGTIPLSKEQFSEQRQKQAAGYVDRTHPALSDVANGSGGVAGGQRAQFENVQFSETASFAAKADARVIAKFADGSPLLVEERAGEGRKLIFASTFDNSTNDFALHSSFVPFVVETARYLAGMEDTPASVVTGTPVELRHRASNGAMNGAADVIGPDGRHALTLNEASKALTFDLERSGFYEISRADGRHVVMAVHADRRESNLQAISDETLELWRNTGDTRGQSVGTGEQVTERPWSFWRWVLGLALAAALIESIFAGRYLREERQTA